jgi:heptosyltransferase III
MHALNWYEDFCRLLVRLAELVRAPKASMVAWLPAIVASACSLPTTIAVATAPPPTPAGRSSEDVISPFSANRLKRPWKRISESQRGSRLRRIVDQLLGCPLLLVLGAFRRKRGVPQQINVIGILSLSAIGDTIVASAIAADLKKANPAAKIIAFIAPGSSGVGRLMAGFDDEIVVPTTRPFSALRIIRKYPMDIMIDVCAWPRITALYATLSHAKFTIGFRTPDAWRHWSFDRAIEHSADRHEVDNFRALLQPLDVSGTSVPHLSINSKPPAGALRRDASSVIVIHPWASGFRSGLKEWPSENWVSMARTMIDEGYSIVITGGPGDAERSLKLSAAINRPQCVSTLAGRAGLVETAMEISVAAAVVTVNTGPMHLAAALNRPLIALHGPTNPLRWGPLSDAARVVVPPSGVGCGYLNLGFEYPPNPPKCMESITVSEVLAQLRIALSGSDRVP